MTSKTARALVAIAATGSLFAAPALTMDAAHAAPVASADDARVIVSPGERGAAVTNVQTYLYTLHFLEASSRTGYYGSKTATAVSAFQKANGLPVTGKVSVATWRLLAAKGKAAPAPKPAAPTPATTDNRVIVRQGQSGDAVKNVQSYLYRLGYLTGDARTGYYGSVTASAVSAFQKANKLPVTGQVTVSTWRLLAAKGKAAPATPQVKLDRRCYTGRTVCVDKSERRMYWVVNGKIKASYTVRTGRPSLPTREGTFKIYLKHPNWRSTLYNVYMPYTQFFSGGQAIHYSRDFQYNGYAGGGSHGCVNMRSKSDAAWLYNQTRIGDRVVVYK